MGCLNKAGDRSEGLGKGKRRENYKYGRKIRKRRGKRVHEAKVYFYKGTKVIPPHDTSSNRNKKYDMILAIKERGAINTMRARKGKGKNPALRGRNGEIGGTKNFVPSY